MKMLYITSLSGKRINGFMRSAIIAATELGIDFTMACNMNMADKEGYIQDCKDYGIKVRHISFERNPLDKMNRIAEHELLELMRQEQFDVVHCNTPIGGVLGRICAKKARIPYVIYMAHGFHFWKGASKKNWLFYYPVEKYLARYTDLLITINVEDYYRAQEFRFKKGGRAQFVHGVGVDTERFAQAKKHEIRKKLGIDEKALVFISVGEMIERKNQMMLIKAFNAANVSNSYLLICGDGELRGQIETYIEEQKLSNVQVLGFRPDIPELLAESDVFVFPSYQEGLPGALMEAMASGTACIASKIRGNVDLLGDDYKYLFDPYNVDELSKMLQGIKVDIRECEKLGQERIVPYNFDAVVEEFKLIYKSAMESVCNET